MSLIRLTILLFFTQYSFWCYGQENKSEGSFNNSFFINTKITDSGKYIISYYRSGCKGYYKQSLFLPNPPLQLIVEKIPILPLPEKKIKFLTVHGNISYDYFYRSVIDTPVNQQNLQQHTERVYLNVLVKEKYPLKINFVSRQSNSPYFKNFIDVNFQFDRYAYNKGMKQQVLDKLKTQVSQYTQYKYPDLTKIQSDLKKQKDQYTAIKTWLEDPATLQKIIEEREREYYKKINKEKDSLNGSLLSNTKSKVEDPNTNINNTKDSSLSVLSGSRIKMNRVADSLASLKNKVLSKKDSIISKVEAQKERLTDSLASIKNKIANKKDSLVGKVKNRIDSLTEPYTKQYERKKHELDSLSKKIDSSKKKVDSIKQKVEKEVQTLKQRIAKATSEKELRKLAEENCIDVDRIDRLGRKLAAIKTFSIGRSMLNYTELTAQNISVSGVNIEYNPSYYVAFAAGKIDYRFRDFYNKNTSHNSQYIVMGRVGIGNIEHKALIFSYFTGRKNTAQFSLSDSVKSYVNIMGYSVEAIYKKDENTSISAEFAKSTKPVTGNLQTNKQTGALLKFSDESNMGINIKVQTIIPETNTRLSGFFRKTGENFQSFSLFSYNTDQTAWMMKADQSFIKGRVNLTGMLRRNDFTNPFTDKTYKTSTVFKSILLNVRFPKYPSLSIGYYPGTQLYMINKEKIRESAYYILNGSVVYSYFLKGLSMNSSFVFNRYTSEATDSGFISYKGTNYYALQTIILKKIQLQGGYSYTKQPELQYYTIETAGDYSLRSWLKVGVGAKYNNISGGNNYWGERVQLSFNLKQFGIFQFQYEKSFLPTINQTLYPVEIGRASYFKSF